MKDQLDLIEKIDGEFKSIIQKIFPDNFVRTSGSSGPHFHASFASENLYYENTDYSYSKELSFFHLTDYRSLFSILNSRVIRMYNLHNANDPEEYEFTAKLFNATKEETDFRKDNIYSFSFCPLSELKNEKVWGEYGRKLTGVAILFDIVNDPKDWDNFHMTNIKYNLSPSVESYVKEIAKLKEIYPGCTFYLELEKIMAFHKRENWKDEREVRILTYNPYKEWDERLKFSKRELKIENGRNRFTEYIDLHLWVDNESAYLQNKSKNPNLDRMQILPDEKYFVTRPRIVIKNILFGKNCGLEPKEYFTYKEKIEQLIKYNFGYTVNIENNLFSL